MNSLQAPPSPWLQKIAIDFSCLFHETSTTMLAGEGEGGERTREREKCGWQEEGKREVQKKRTGLETCMKRWDHWGGKGDRNRGRERKREEPERGNRVGVVASPLDCYWFSVSLRVHQLFLSISFTSPSPPCTQLRHPPYTSSSSSHSPSLHHHPSQPPIYFPICRPVSLPYIPEALSHGTHISFSCPIAPSLSMISISLSLTVYLYSTTSSRFMSKWKNTGESGWTEMIDERIDDR